MIVNKEIKQLINDYSINCINDFCKKQSEELYKFLINAIRSDKVVEMKYIGEYKLNYNSKFTRPVYELVHVNGNKFKFAFTGLSNIQVFSRRNRSTHCYSSEFYNRLGNFLGIK